MPQQDLLFPWRTVRENLLLPMEIRGGYSKTEMREKADAALESVGLKDWGDKTPKELSGGMRQRAAFARTVLTGSDLLHAGMAFRAVGEGEKDSPFYHARCGGSGLFVQPDPGCRGITDHPSAVH